MKKVILIVLLTALLFGGENGKSVNTNNKFDVIIVGGGFSGLTAAYLLKEKNILVLEKEEVAGGRCISGEWNGFHYPKGTEYIGKPDPEMQEFFDELGIETEEIPPPTDGVAMNGKFYFSENLLDFLTKEEQEQYYDLQEKLIELNNKGIEEAVFDRQKLINKYKALDKISVKEWYTENGYSPVIQKFVDVENRGLFGTDNANFSMFFNIPEMAFNLPDPSSIEESEVYSFNNGMFSIIEALASKLGDKVITGAVVEEVKVKKDKSVAVTYVKNGEKIKVFAKSVIMSTPAPVTGKIVKNYFSQEVKSVLSGIKYSQYATINFFTTKRFLKDTWSVSCIDEGEVVTLYDVIRPQVSKNYNGKSILSVYMAPENAFDFKFIYKTGNQLVKSAYKTLNKYYNGFENEVLGFDINRFQYAFPIFEPGYGKKINILRRDKTVKGPIFLAGDYMVYAIVDGALISAYKAVYRVEKYLKTN